MRRQVFQSWILIFVLAVLTIGPAFMPRASVRAQAATPSPDVQLLLDSMSPEERVGQLFLVSFDGTDISDTSPVYDLIVNHHVGGVVLTAGNDNFASLPDTVEETKSLISGLQQIEWSSSVNETIDPATGQPSKHNYAPLLVGITQGGGGYPYDQIMGGLTALPDPMAIGATWDPDLSRQVGDVMGQELSALGFNLYLGPSLDVLEEPNLTGDGDLGTRVFGGDPFWVGKMGSAYITGLHQGSEGQMLVIAKHFPGRGSSDRLPEQEVATVRKSLEQLKQIELPPFFMVTGDAADPQARVDGLLVSHIRYQGFQGNIRATTKPVSFDATALSTILELPQFSSWRDSGGLMVSDDLGSQAVRNFYAPGGSTFTARLVVRDAFLAGNDLLYLGNISGSDSPDTYSTVLRILEYFTQKYREDTAFAQRVDASVTRILEAKYKLYGSLQPARIYPKTSLLDANSIEKQVPFDVARQSATLISPDLRDLDTVLPSPPSPGEYMVFITDSKQVQQCSTCLERPTMAFDAFQQAVMRLYGPSAGGQVYGTHLKSYTFSDLQSLLDSTNGVFLRDDLTQADWVVISMTDTTQGQPQLIRRFLSERQDLLRAKRIILFSFSAPYYLDATDISKLTAYFCLFSKGDAFVDVAARLLYQELTPTGNSPVSIPSIGYDLISVTTPDPEQIIPLNLDFPTESTTLEPGTTPQATPVPLYKIGDNIAVRTGEILDHNGHVVPDGTVVRFTLQLNGEGGGILQQADAFTTGGIARTSFRLEKEGLIEIRATSDPATLSDILQLDVTGEAAVAVTVIAPAPTIATTEATPLPTVQPRETGFVTSDGYPRGSSWLLCILLLVGGSWVAFRAGIGVHSPRWGLRWGLSVLLSGLIFYNYLALGLPGGAVWVKASGVYGVLGFTFLGELIGFLIGWFWTRRSSVSG